MTNLQTVYKETTGYDIETPERKVLEEKYAFDKADTASELISEEQLLELKRIGDNETQAEIKDLIEEDYTLDFNDIIKFAMINKTDELLEVLGKMMGGYTIELVTNETVQGFEPLWVAYKGVNEVVETVSNSMEY